MYAAGSRACNVLELAAFRSPQVLTEDFHGCRVEDFFHISVCLDMLPCVRQKSKVDSYGF